jgi:hypothetical protein
MMVEVEIGISDDEWTEVTNRMATKPRPNATSTAAWIPLDGSEDVIIGDLTVLSDGEPVRAAQPRAAEVAPAETAGKVEAPVLTPSPR